MTYQMYVPIILCVDVYGMVQTLRELNIYCVLGRMECQRFILNILIYRFVYPTTIIFVSHLLMCHFRGRNWVWNLQGLKGVRGGWVGWVTKFQWNWSNLLIEVGLKQVDLPYFFCLLAFSLIEYCYIFWHSLII